MKKKRLQNVVLPLTVMDYCKQPEVWKRGLRFSTVGAVCFY
jgi:hypothetical protein